MLLVRFLYLAREGTHTHKGGGAAKRTTPPPRRRTRRGRKKLCGSFRSLIKSEKNTSPLFRSPKKKKKLLTHFPFFLLFSSCFSFVRERVVESLAPLPLPPPPPPLAQENMRPVVQNIDRAPVLLPSLDRRKTHPFLFVRSGALSVFCFIERRSKEAAASARVSRFPPVFWDQKLRSERGNA